MTTRQILSALSLAAALGVCGSLQSQVQTIVPAVIPGAEPVTVQNIKIHGTYLEGNLEGDAVDRDVIVYLPPSYAKDKKQRYPVVYALHGYSIGAEQWSHEIHVPQTRRRDRGSRLRRRCRPMASDWTRSCRSTIVGAHLLTMGQRASHWRHC